ncbi:MAG: DUF4123 domain-containing protein [Paracoccus sp. (in: a-proteobacteria)]
MSIPHNHEYNPWSPSQGNILATPPEPEPPTLQIKTIEGVEPLDRQIGMFPKKTVPDTLRDILFGQPISTVTGNKTAYAAAVPLVQTYAILDAAKVANLPELLERSGLEHRCLFKGNAYDELKNVAPWIVRLEEDNAFTRHLFTSSDAVWHLWDKEPGIYIRAQRTLDDVWRHFRKFTRMQDERGKWYYFRFYEGSAFLSLAKTLSKSEVGELLPEGMTVISLLPKGGKKAVLMGSRNDST